jgi:hypothetical protein
MSYIPKPGSPIAPPRAAVTVVAAPAPSIDPRLQVYPRTFRGGELSRLGIGRYATEAGTCAARAVR